MSSARIPRLSLILTVNVNRKNVEVFALVCFLSTLLLLFTLLSRHGYLFVALLLLLDRICDIHLPVWFGFKSIGCNKTVMCTIRFFKWYTFAVSWVGRNLDCVEGVHALDLPTLLAFGNDFATHSNHKVDKDSEHGDTAEYSQTDLLLTLVLLFLGDISDLIGLGHVLVLCHIDVLDLGDDLWHVLRLNGLDWLWNNRVGFDWLRFDRFHRRNWLRLGRFHRIRYHGVRYHGIRYHRIRFSRFRLHRIRHYWNNWVGVFGWVQIERTKLDGHAEKWIG